MTDRQSFDPEVVEQSEEDGTRREDGLDYPDGEGDDAAD